MHWLEYYIIPDRENSSFITLLASILVVLSLSLNVLAVPQPGSMGYYDNVSMVFNYNSTFSLGLSDPPTSIWLEGRVRGSADVQVYLINGQERILMFNNSDLLEDEPILDTEVDAIISLINATDQEESSGILTALEYANGTQWDPDDDGKTYFLSAIDLSVRDSVFNFEADTEKACTIWQIYSVYSGNLTTTCYGSVDCCKLYGLLPSPNTRWDTNMYLTYGRFSAAEKNLVGAKVAYADVDLDSEVPKYDVYRGEWDFKPAFFYEPQYSLPNECINTCDLDLETPEIYLEFHMPASTSIELEGVGYIGRGKDLEIPAGSNSTFTLSVVAGDGNARGHYEMSEEEGVYILMVDSSPKRRDISGNITDQSEWNEDILVLENPTAHKMLNAEKRPIGNVKFKGLNSAQGNVTIIFLPSDDPLISTPILVIDGNMSFEEANSEMVQKEDVFLVSKCIRLADDTSCIEWEPYTSDFTSDGKLIRFDVSDPGMYAGLVTSVLDYFVQYADSAKNLFEPSMNTNMEWELDIMTRYDEDISFEVLITAPFFAKDIRLIDRYLNSDVELIEIDEETHDTRSFQVSLRGGRNYTLSYVTDGPTKEEVILSSERDVYVKEILISSNTPFQNIPAFTSIPNVPRNEIIIYYSDGTRRMRTDPTFNLTFSDPDGDGGMNWAYWTVPNTSDEVYTMVCDLRLTDNGNSGAHGLTKINAGGSRSTEISPVANSRLIDGQMRPYDTNIVLGNDNEFKAADVDHQARFPESIGKPISFGVNGGVILSEPLATNDVSVLVGGDTITYYGAWEATDLAYTVSGQGIKEKIILHNGSSPKSFTFKLELQGLALREDEIFELYDRQGQLAFTFSRPYAYDSRGRRGQVTDVLERRNKDYYYTMEVDETFLEKAAYPVVIDPTFDLADSEVSTDGDTDGLTITSDALTMMAGYVNPGVSRAFIEFNISSIPDSAILSGPTPSAQFPET